MAASYGTPLCFWIEFQGLKRHPLSTGQLFQFSSSIHDFWGVSCYKTHF